MHTPWASTLYGGRPYTGERGNNGQGAVKESEESRSVWDFDIFQHPGQIQGEKAGICDLSERLAPSTRALLERVDV
jgi:hypothetical protein